MVACVDGLDPRYLKAAFAAGKAPYLRTLNERGWCRAALSAMPSFTNPNNVSIVTGVTPAVHGIAGNYFYDPAAGAEVMMNDPRFLRVPTILQALAAAGSRVAVVTAKDKLRRLLGKGLPDGPSALCVSVESPGGEAAKYMPAQQPSIYSAQASEAVFAAGRNLLEEWRADLLYLSTTDYVQHKHAPGEAQADLFVEMIDGFLAAMDARGARIVVTADHGMNAMAGPDGRPNIVFLADTLDRAAPGIRARVVLPITDPYVRHHGALGGFATVYLDDSRTTDAVRPLIAALPGIEKVLGRDEACAALELPGDRIGDLCVIAAAGFALGTRAAEHDLSGLDRPLRSHGGIHEQAVPFITNFEPDAALAGKPLRNFDAFAAALSPDGEAEAAVAAPDRQGRA